MSLGDFEVNKFHVLCMHTEKFGVSFKLHYHHFNMVNAFFVLKTVP